MDKKWIEKQREELEKHFSPKIHELRNLERQRMFDELLKQDRSNTNAFAVSISRNAQRSSIELEKIKRLEEENRQLKQKLAFQMLSYNGANNANS
jgi:hypothetical protein